MSRTGLAGVASLALIAMAFGPCADERLSNEEFRFAAQATASASILRIEDVPAGWRIAPHGAIDPGSSGESGPAGECPVFANEEEGWAGQSAYAESDVLIGPTHEINTSASVFREAGAAQEILSDYFDLLEACSGQILDFARGDTDFGPGDEFSFHEIEVLELGDEARGIRVEGADDGASFVVDVLYIRQGRVLVTFVYGGSAAADSERDWFAAVQVGKARAADEALPD